MPRVYIIADERYPDYSIWEGDPLPGWWSIDLTDDELDRINKAVAEYEDIQKLINDRINNSDERSQP